MATLSNTSTLDLTVKDDITFAVVDNSAFELIDSVGATAWLFKDSVNTVNRLQIAPTVIQFYGQDLIGNTTSAGTLTLKSTTHATKGTVVIGSTASKSAYDEVNDRLGLQTLAPTEVLHLAAGNIYAATGVLKVAGTGNSYVMGSLGIGTTVPSQLLDVQGTGATIGIQLKNNQATGQGNAVLFLDKAANGNSAYIQFSKGGTTGFAIGTGMASVDEDFRLRKTSSGENVIVAEYTGAVTNTLYLKAGNVGIGTASPNNGVTLSRSSVGSALRIDCLNTDGTNAASHAWLVASVGGALSGDPAVVYDISGVKNWIMGIDNSDADKFKIAESGALGTSDRLVIDIGGYVGVNAPSPVSQLHVVGQMTLDKDDAGVTPEQLKIRGATNTNHQLLIGFNTTSNYGSLQAITQGVAYRTLALNPGGGGVAVAATSASVFKLQVAGDIGPNAHNSYALGSSSYKFNDIWGMKGHYATSLEVGGADPGANVLYVNGAIRIDGQTGTASGGILGYIVMNVDGTSRRIPFYSA